jgi:hypothetical protein
MTSSPYTDNLRVYIISSHPYLFDVRFRALRWCGSGEVTLKDIHGGVNEARAVVEADEEGYAALKTAGFAIEQIEAHRATAGW